MERQYLVGLTHWPHVKKGTCEVEEVYLYINICVPIYMQMSDLKEIAALIFPNYTFAFTNNSINQSTYLSNYICLYRGRERLSDLSKLEIHNLAAVALQNHVCSTDEKQTRKEH